MNEPLIRKLSILTSIAQLKFSQPANSESKNECLIFFIKKYIEIELQNITFDIAVNFIVLQALLEHILMKRKKVNKATLPWLIRTK